MKVLILIFILIKIKMKTAFHRQKMEAQTIYVLFALNYINRYWNQSCSNLEEHKL